MSDRERRPARERLRQERERAARRRARNRALLITGAAAIVVIAGVLAGVLARGGPKGAAGVSPAFYTGPFAPLTLNSHGAATMAQPGVAKPVLVIWEDFQCPICDEFERANGATVQRLAQQGKVKVVYHPFTIFIGEQPQQANSVRAWAAARCVPASRWLLYHNLLYSNQPPETQQGGFPVSQLLRLGARIGLTSQAFRACVTSQRYASQGVPLSEGIIAGGITGTPTVTLNGRKVGNQILISPGGALRQMILSAP